MTTHLYTMSINIYYISLTIGAGALLSSCFISLLISGRKRIMIALWISDSSATTILWNVPHSSFFLSKKHDATSTINSLISGRGI